MHCTLGHLFDDQLGVGGVVRFQLANNHLALPTKRIATLVRLGRGCGRLLLVMMVATVVFCSLTAHYNRSNCQGDKAYNGKVKKKKKRQFCIRWKLLFTNISLGHQKCKLNRFFQLEFCGSVCDISPVFLAFMPSHSVPQLHCQIGGKNSFLPPTPITYWRPSRHQLMSNTVYVNDPISYLIAFYFLSPPASVCLELNHFKCCS